MTTADLIRENLESLVRANMVYGCVYDALDAPMARALAPDSATRAFLLAQLETAMGVMAAVLNLAGITREEGIEAARQIDRERRALAQMMAD